MAACKKAWSVEMDSAIISLVKNYPILWNSKDKKYKRFSHKRLQVLHKIVLEMKRMFPQNSAMFTVALITERFNVLKRIFVQEMRRQAKEHYVPRRRRFVHYDELSFLKKVYEENREKPRDNISSSIDISKFQPILPRGGFVRLAAPAAAPVFPQSCQLVIMNETNPKASEQQTIFHQLGGVLSNQVVQRPLKPKPPSEKTNVYYKIILPKRMTGNENEIHEVTTNQDKSPVQSSTSSFDSPSTVCIKEQKSDENIANDDMSSSTSSKSSVPFGNSNGRIKTKSNEQRSCLRVTLENNTSAVSRSVLNKQLLERSSTISSDSLVLKIKQELFSPDDSHEKADGCDENFNECLSETAAFSKNMSQAVNKAQNEPYPELEERIYDVENTVTIGGLLIPKTEMGTCSGLVNSNTSDSNSESQITHRNSTSLESEFSPVAHASASDVSSEDNHDSKCQINPVLPVIETVFSAETPEDVELNERLESFGNYVTTKLRGMTSKSRIRIVTEIWNMLQNPDV